MYLGRIVGVGMTPSGNGTVMYRVSSRSFPNREAVANGDAIAIMPRAGFEDDLKKSPYITYNCFRTAGSYAIASNGSHTDPITEKIAMGMSPRDAISLGLLAMDYEKDDYNTPRIISVVSKTEAKGWLGIICKDGLIVREFALNPGEIYYVSTYEHTLPCIHYMDKAFSAEIAAEVCQYSIDGGVFAEFEFPVTAAAAVVVDGKVTTATQTV
jgi:IMP cyclohydrolase